MRIGVVGCGMVSHAYCGTIARAEGVALAALASRTRRSAEARAAQYGGTATSVDALLADPTIDLVVVLAPPALHHPLGRRVLEAGKHLYLEKPLATSLADAADLLALAAARGLSVGCAPDTMLGEGHRRAKRLVEAGAIGTIVGGAATFASGGMEGWHAAPGFFYAARRRASARHRTLLRHATGRSARPGRRGDGVRHDAAAHAHGPRRGDHPGRGADDRHRRAPLRGRRDDLTVAVLGHTRPRRRAAGAAWYRGRPPRTRSERVRRRRPVERRWGFLAPEGPIRAAPPPDRCGARHRRRRARPRHRPADRRADRCGDAAAPGRPARIGRAGHRGGDPHRPRAAGKRRARPPRAGSAAGAGAIDRRGRGGDDRAPARMDGETDMDDQLPAWAIGPFSAPTRVLEDRLAVTFACPLAGEVEWCAKDAFNPGAVVHDGKVCLLVRGEDRVGRYAGTSRIGLATSSDGVSFQLEPEPVLAPGDDRWQAWEWPGGIEDPRVVQGLDGSFVCTYTAFDGKVGCLFVATSPDLRRWTKHGPAFAGTPYVRRPTKAGAIVTTLQDGRLVAARIDGRYWMYWGEGTIFAATSDDLVRWTPLEAESAPDRYLTWDPALRGPMGHWTLERVPGPQGLRAIAGPRRHRFDSLLTEPGPPPVLTPDGVVLIYNGGNHHDGGVADAPPFAYQPGQLLFDAHDPTAVTGRLTHPFLRVDPAEADGQVGNVVFAEGLVAWRGQWLLYLGLADSRIGVATAPLPAGSAR